MELVNINYGKVHFLIISQAGFESLDWCISVVSHSDSLATWGIRPISGSDVLLSNSCRVEGSQPRDLMPINKEKERK